MAEIATKTTTKKPKEKDPIGVMRALKAGYQYVYKIMPGYYIANLIQGVFHGLSHGVTALITALFFDKVALAIEGIIGVNAVIPWLLLYFGIIIITQVLNGTHNFTHGVIGRRSEGYIATIIHEKASRIDPVAYETPSNLDDIEKAFKGSSNLNSFLMTATTIFTFYLPYFIFMAFFLHSVNPLLVLAIALAFLPSILSLQLRVKVSSKLEDKLAPQRRAMEYYEKSISDIAFLKETRILGAFNYLRSLFEGAIAGLNKDNFREKGKLELYRFLLDIVSLVGFGLVIGYSMYLLIQGDISVGSFAAVQSSLMLLFGIMNEIVNGHLGRLSENFGTIRNLIRFLDLPEMSGESGVMDAQPAISIKNASFRYPMAEHDSLKSVSLEINPGETIAIVGENGAGKTTLVRLITGIYRPTEGEVTVGGLNTSEVAPGCIFESTTGVFQKYQRYKMTLDDNIRISSFDKSGDISATADEAGVDVADSKLFPDGPQTMLSREFDGVDLSGGQWQRVALARGFYRDHSLIVLDEPTAAIDPIEESRIYRQFVGIARGKTAIIVTHRMGSATIADRVVVMDRGEIVDIGTHDQLMERQGLYHDMFNAQSVWYEKAENA